MQAGVQPAVSLGALSARQQRLVESHLPLVHHTLRRLRDRLLTGRAGREHAELVQEGCLALVEAFRSHDAALHGAFASYAMARVHQAVSRYAQEREGAIRVPYSTQRRRRRSLDGACGQADRHRPDAAPRALPLMDEPPVRRRQVDPREEAADRDEVAAGPTISERFRLRYESLARAVLAEMKRDPRCRPDTRRIIEACRRQRWEVPEPEARRSLRELAKEHGCSLGRITHCEARFFRRLGERLKRDPVSGELIRMARQSPDGWRHRWASD